MAIQKGVRVVISGICVGINTVTTLRFVNIATQLSHKQEIANFVRDQFIDNFKIGCSASMQFLSLYVTDDDVSDDSPYILPIQKVGSGTQGPTQIALQLNLLTGVAGRRGRGRLFVPGIRDGVFPGSSISSSVLLSGNAQVTNIKNAFCVGGSTGWTLGVYSRKDEQIRPVVDITINNIPSALRSRKVGVGV